MENNDNFQLNIDSEPQVADATQTADPQKRKINKFWDILIWVLIAILALAVLIRAFVFTNVTISGASMEETYHGNDVVRVVKIGKPERGDVVVFYKSAVDSKFKALFAKGDDVKEGGKYEKLIKRVVAVEGDSIWVEPVDGGYRLVVKTADGKTLYEDYYKKGGEALSESSFVMSSAVLGQLVGLTEDNPLVIEKDHFFAMGDNRGNSEDSRGVLGQVPLDQLFGIVINK